MALITLSGLVSSIKGKLNGSYFQTKKNSTSINNISPRRSKAKASQIKLQNAQQRLTKAARTWRTIGAELQAAWAAAALTMSRINKNGVVYTPSGYQLFTEVNVNAAFCGELAPSTPQTPAEPMDVVPLNSVFNIDNELTIQFGTGVPADKFVLVYASAPCSQGVAYPQSGYRFIDKYRDIALAEVVIQSAYAAVWRTPNLGERVFVKFVVVDAAAFTQDGAKLTKADAG